jgi:hypothetical protein
LWNNSDLIKFRPCYSTAIWQHWLMSDAINLLWPNCIFSLVLFGCVFFFKTENPPSTWYLRIERKSININTGENIIILIVVKIGVRTKYPNVCFGCIDISLFS